MTIEKPLWMQANTYPARLDRAAIAALLAEGTLSGFTVAQRGAGANMSVDVAAGKAIVTGDDQANQGNYYVTSTATENVVVSAAPGSNSRYDIVILQINDPNAGGAAGSNMQIQVIAGTAAASPVAPATPASALLLATIGPILTSTTSITNAMITNVAAVATLAFDVVDDAQGTRLGVSAATASALVRRDAAGRTKFAQGVAAGDALVFPITGAQITDGGIATADLADGAVTDVKLAGAAGGSLNSGTIQYRKMGNMVFVWTTPQWNSSVSATLPSGYRPSAACGAAGAAGSDSAEISIATSGAITASTLGNWRFTAAFQVA